MLLVYVVSKIYAIQPFCSLFEFLLNHVFGLHAALDTYGKNLTYYM